MRLRLALLAAAAVIFAPYPSGPTSSEPPGGADLAARVLAPTVDEGAIRSATHDVNHHLTSRQATRLSSAPSVMSLARILQAGVAFSILWLLGRERIRSRHRLRCSLTLGRGPPLLNLA